MSGWGLALPFGLALLLNLLITPLIRRIGIRLGRVSAPRPDRWHKHPTPTLGGVGIFIAFGASLLLGYFSFSSGLLAGWGFLSGAVIVFIVGLWDEFHPLSPIAKLIAQILAATPGDRVGVYEHFLHPAHC